MSFQTFRLVVILIAGPLLTLGVVMFCVASAIGSWLGMAESLVPLLPACGLIWFVRQVAKDQGGERWPRK